jgi:hypothetical protein
MGPNGAKEAYLPVSINVHLEKHPSSTSQPFHLAGSKYGYREASSLTDKPARLTERQAVFYRNLIRISERLQSQELPIDFVDAEGIHMAMDLGCVKIAEHAGFLAPLANGQDGVMKTIRLSWLVLPQ